MNFLLNKAKQNCFHDKTSSQHYSIYYNIARNFQTSAKIPRNCPRKFLLLPIDRLAPIFFLPNTTPVSFLSSVSDFLTAMRRFMQLFKNAKILVPRKINKQKIVQQKKGRGDKKKNYDLFVMQRSLKIISFLCFR